MDNDSPSDYVDTLDIHKAISTLKFLDVLEEDAQGADVEVTYGLADIFLSHNCCYGSLLIDSQSCQLCI